MRRLLPFIIASIFALASCGGDESECQVDKDCYSGESCVERTCKVVAPNSSNNVNAANAANSGNSANATNSDFACIVDPFAMCEDAENDDDNDEWPGVAATSMTRGCPNDFVPLDMTISGRMCQRESADIYNYIFYECEVGFIIEAILDVKTECDPSLITFDVSGYPGRCGEDNPNLICETLEDGKRRIRLLVPASDFPTGSSIYFYVETDPERSDIQLDYDLQLIVRQ